VTRRTWVIVGLTVVAAAAAGGYLLPGAGSNGGWSGRASDDRLFVPPDPWYRLPPSEFFGAAETQNRDSATFAVIPHAAESLSRLERSPWAEVSEQEAAGLAGRPLGGSGGRLVLLRALAWDTPYGGFNVRWRSGEVFVQHGSLGTHPLPVVRRAVVARLPDLPSEVYVGLERAE
jgi:hypothetical protein